MDAGYSFRGPVCASRADSLSLLEEEEDGRAHADGRAHGGGSGKWRAVGMIVRSCTPPRYFDRSGRRVTSCYLAGDFYRIRALGVCCGHI